MPLERSREPDSFTAFEHEGWSRVIEDYQHLFGRLTQQAVEATLDATGVKAGDRLLDICTGHAILAAAAASRGAIVRGLDFSEAVLAVARRKAPALVFDPATRRSYLTQPRASTWSCVALASSTSPIRRAALRRYIAC